MKKRIWIHFIIFIPMLIISIYLINHETGRKHLEGEETTDYSKLIKGSYLLFDVVNGNEIGDLAISSLNDNEILINVYGEETAGIDPFIGKAGTYKFGNLNVENISLTKQKEGSEYYWIGQSDNSTAILLNIFSTDPIISEKIQKKHRKFYLIRFVDKLYGNYIMKGERSTLLRKGVAGTYFLSIYAALFFTD